jgi:hypothetical protein
MWEFRITYPPAYKVGLLVETVSTEAQARIKVRDFNMFLPRGAPLAAYSNIPIAHRSPRKGESL